MLKEQQPPLLKGQVALVTGANSGIGEGIARAMAAAGAAVIVNYVSHPDAAGTIAHDITSAGGRALAIAADVSQEADVHALFRRAIDAFGTVDILVNNAGIQDDAPLVDMTLDQWNRVLAVNLTGQFLCAREAALLHLIPYGRIGESDDIGNVAVWLASDAADYLTGATLFVDGGMTLYPGFSMGG